MVNAEIMRVLIGLVFFIFMTISPVIAQSWRTPVKDTTPAREWEEDSFAESLEQQQQKKIIILSQETNLPEQYEEPKRTPQIIPEKELKVNNGNAVVYLVPKNYTGVKIQIAESEGEALAEDDDIFFRHGNIMAEKKDDGGYTYLIGHFNDEQQAQQYLDNHYSEMYPDAKVARFEEGRRLY